MTVRIHATESTEYTELPHAAADPYSALVLVNRQRAAVRLDVFEYSDEGIHRAQHLLLLAHVLGVSLAAALTVTDPKESPA